MEIKRALADARFRERIPVELKDKLAKYLHCPSCGANVQFLREILANCKEQLLEYFPGHDLLDEQEEVRKLSENHWIVINCHINELEAKLRALPPGRKQIAICRYEDQVTVVVNELDILW